MGDEIAFTIEDNVPTPHAELTTIRGCIVLHSVRGGTDTLDDLARLRLADGLDGEEHGRAPIEKLASTKVRFCPINEKKLPLRNSPNRGESLFAASEPAWDPRKKTLIEIFSKERRRSCVGDMICTELPGVAGALPASRNAIALSAARTGVSPCIAFVWLRPNNLGAAGFTSHRAR